MTEFTTSLGALLRELHCPPVSLLEDMTASDMRHFRLPYAVKAAVEKRPPLYKTIKSNKYRCGVVVAVVVAVVVVVTRACACP